MERIDIDTHHWWLREALLAAIATMTGDDFHATVKEMDEQPLLVRLTINGRPSSFSAVIDLFEKEYHKDLDLKATSLVEERLGKVRRAAHEAVRLIARGYREALASQFPKLDLDRETQ